MLLGDTSGCRLDLYVINHSSGSQNFLRVRAKCICRAEVEGHILMQGLEKEVHFWGWNQYLPQLKMHDRQCLIQECVIRVVEGPVRGPRPYSTSAPPWFGLKKGNLYKGTKWLRMQEIAVWNNFVAKVLCLLCVSIPSTLDALWEKNISQAKWWIAGKPTSALMVTPVMHLPSVSGHY